MGMNSLPYSSGIRSLVYIIFILRFLLHLRLFSDVRQAMFTRTAFGDLFVNYGVSPDADDDLVAESNAECALRCLKEYYSCDYILYSSQSRRCMLLRLYEADYSDAFTIVDVKGFSRAGYVAFKLNF